MNRYYLNGKEITVKQYEQIQRDNNRAVEMANKTGDIGYMWGCKFVTVWDDGRPDHTA